jgi:hypothetical protein
LSNATKFLLLAFSLGITCLLIVYFKRVADTGFDTSNTAMEQLAEFNLELSENELTMYDGLDVTGSDVVNFIKKQLGEYSTTETAPLYVYVKTSASETSYQNGALLSNIQNFSSTYYVKPVAKFTCGIIRDANDVIIGVTFQQR